MGTTITGITRVRNESLIIADTIEHYLKYCDDIILYDDCSIDDTVAIAKRVGGHKLTVIYGDWWRTNRVMENTRHRAILLEAARDQGAEWCLCFDADERLVGTLPPLAGAGYRFRLFDGYLTKEYQLTYYRGDRLEFLERLWGPEYRDIVMLFRVAAARFVGAGTREPKLQGPTALAFVKVKHYGKCISVEQWEETCDYYANSHFPRSFRAKWAARRGKAIHTVSDFGRPLYTWSEIKAFSNYWVKI